MRNLLSIPALALLLYCHLESKGMAAELNGRVIVTRNLTKKRVTLPVYQFRGMSSVHDHDTSQPVNEYSELVVFLEGNSSDAGKPVPGGGIARQREGSSPHASRRSRTWALIAITRSRRRRAAGTTACRSGLG